jgi:hypothetical protein
MKVPTKLRAAGWWIIGALVVLRIVSLLIWPLLGALVVVAIIVVGLKLLFKDRFY